MRSSLRALKVIAQLQCACCRQTMTAHANSRGSLLLREAGWQNWLCQMAVLLRRKVTAGHCPRWPWLLGCHSSAR